MEKTIIQEYLNGKSINQLSKEYPLSYRKIQQLLVNNNITIRGGRKKKTLTAEQEKILKEKFDEGVPVKEIAKILKLDTETLTNMIKERKYTRTTNRVNKRIKSDYFSKIDSPEKAYWLGFLYTDGSVDHYKKTGRIRLQLQAADEEILIQYKEDLGLDCKLIEDIRPNSKCLSVEFNDEQIFNDLATYNIIPNKTYKSHHIPFEKIPSQYLTSYLLGLFDGDGNFSCSENFSTDVTFGFTAYYEEVAKDFQLEIDKLIDKTDHNKPFFTSAWHVQWRGRTQVLKILDKLYKDCPRHLARKYNKYLQLKDSLK